MEVINGPATEAHSLIFNTVILFSEGYSRSCYKKSMCFQLAKHITLLPKPFQPLC